MLEPGDQRQDTPPTPAAPSDGAWKIALAIVVAAVLVAGTIFIVSRGPDECVEWNNEMLTTLREVEQITNAPPGTIPPEEQQALAARARRKAAEHPGEDCEISQEVQDKLDELS